MSAADGLHCIEDARIRAKRRLPRMMFDFIDGAAGAEIGHRLNCSHLDQVRLQPSILVNVEDRRLGRPFLGHDWGLPFGIAPMGMCDLAWPGADRLLAAAAVRHGIPHCLSTAASTSLEDARRLAGEHAWFQLYVKDTEDAAFDLVRRAEQAGYRHLLLTVDVASLGPRRRELRHGFKVPFRLGARQALDFALHPRWSIETLWRGVPTFANYLPPDDGKGGRRGRTDFDRGKRGGWIDWAFLDRLRRRWPNKLIVKGVLSPDEAVRIRDAGADAVYVSNHGGRQLDSAPAAIGALPLIRRAVGDAYPLIFDGGVRCGEGVVKALALGADFVMLGRPFLYALGAAGEQGLAKIIQLLADEISHTLALIGRPDVADIDGGVIAAPAMDPVPMRPFRGPERTPSPEKPVEHRQPTPVAQGSKQ